MTFVILAFLSLWYIIPFLIGALLPNRRWLGIYTAIAFLLTAYILYDLYQIPEAKRFDGPGGVFGLIFSILLAWGAYSGIACRWLIFLLKKYVTWKHLRLVITLIGFLSLPVWYGVSHFYGEWKRRPPSKECVVNNLDFVLAGYEIKVVPTDIIFADTSDGTGRADDRLDNFYSSFSVPHVMRKYCDATKQGKSPLTANMIFFGFDGAYNSNKTASYKLACQNSIGRWPRDQYCDENKKDSLPPSLHIFDSKKYDNNPYDKMPENLSSYRWYLEHKSEYSVDPKYPDFLRKGKSIYWVSKSIRVGNNQEPLSAICGFADDYSKRNVLCHTVYQVMGDIYIDYYIRLSWENPDKDARVVYDKVNDFISFLDLTKKEERENE
ncbi:MAG: hypothetical protein RBR86_08140 [Pseudobdellovibrionaceae bacterium]|jgi:hypothetical protein|nr:hypothetical protein [Pseudobdellovibrionaceae bacterium]